MTGQLSSMQGQWMVLSISSIQDRYSQDIRTSNKISRSLRKPRDGISKSSYGIGILQRTRQHCCQAVCRISEREGISKPRSRNSETSWDLVIWRHIVKWIEALDGSCLRHPTRQNGGGECAQMGAIATSDVKGWYHRLYQRNTPHGHPQLHLKTITK